MIFAQVCEQIDMIFAQEPENQIFVLYSVSYLIIGRYKEERDVPPPPPVQFIHFHAVFGKNYTK